jgi:signal transduction histidine kinase/DNA-binding response OmpR family regulator/ligand-binding sensor domain-containing protein
MSFYFLFINIGHTQNTVQTNVKFIGVNNGLSHREVYAINQDQQGFIWMATRMGLDRYDGTAFLHFKYPDGYTKQVNRVSSFKDRQDVFWLIGLGRADTSKVDHPSLLLFDFKKQTFLSWEEYQGGQAPFSWDEVKKLKIIGKDALAFSLKDGRNYIWNQRSFLLLPRKVQLESTVAVFQSNIFFWQIKADSVWDLVHWSNKKEAALLPDISSTNRFKYKASVLDSIVYFSNVNEGQYELYSFDQTGSFKQNFAGTCKTAKAILGNYDSPNLHYTDERFLWNISQGRLMRLCLKDQQVLPFDSDQSISSNTPILALHFGSLGEVWMGTHNGVYLYQFLEIPFQKYLYNPLAKDLDDQISLRGLLVQDQTLIANSYQGQYLIDLSIKQANAKLLRGDIYYPIIEGNAGEQLFGWDQLNRRIPGIEALERIPNDSLLGKREFWSLKKDVLQNIWVGTDKGLAILRSQDSLLRPYTQFNAFPAIQEATVNHFLEIGHKQYLLATSRGIFKLDINKGIVDHFHEGGTDPNHLPFNDFNHIHQSEDGIFWLASAGAGLLRWDLESGDYKQYNLENGLSNEVLYSIYEDKRGFLWIGSDYGLIRFNKQYEELMVYLEKDGISHHEFNRIAHYQAKDGTLYFGTINGVTVFNPLQILPKRQSDFPLVLSQLTQLTDGERNETTAFADGLPKLLIRPKDRLYNLQFRLLDYFGAERSKYVYKIAGYQEEWFEIEGGSFMIPGLPYGNYSLLVRGQDANGRNTASELIIPIQVLKPWWQKPWFWLLLLVVLGSVVIGFSIYRVRQSEYSKQLLEGLVQQRTEELQADKKTIEVQSQELKQMSYLKSKFFVNIAHELRTPLTLLKGPISSVLKSNELGNRNFTMLAMAQNNLQKILQLIEEILDLGKLEEGKLKVESKSVQLKEFLDQLILNFKTLAQEKQVKLNSEHQFPPKLVLSVDASKLDKVLSNLLSNALRFTPSQGTIDLKVREQNQQLYFNVIDSGPGIPEMDLPFIFDRYYQSESNNQSAEGTGIGLAISKEYGALLGGKLTVKNQESGGAHFQFTLPFEIAQKDGGTFQRQEHGSYVGEGGSVPFAKPNAISGTASILPRGSILVVEDHKDLRNYLDTILKENSWKVQTKANGKQALDYLKNCATEELPVLIMTDMMMPVLSGQDFVKALKGDKKFERIPLLVLTAKTGQNDRLNMLYLGVDDYLTKPFSLEELLARINNLNRNYQQRNLAKENYSTVEPSPSQEWLKEVQTLILNNKEDFDFSVNVLAEKLNMSRRQLYRKMHLESGLTPNEFIQEVKFQMARSLLEDRTVDTVKALAFTVGIKDVVNFSKNYKKRFGKLPSEYL